MELDFWAKYELHILQLKGHVSWIPPFSLVGGIKGVMDDVYERLKLFRNEVIEMFWEVTIVPRLGCPQKTIRYIDAWVRALRE